MTNKEMVKKTLKGLRENGIYYKAVTSKNELVILLGFENAPSNYKQYVPTEEDQLMYLFRELKPEVKTKTEYGFIRKEIRIKA